MLTLNVAPILFLDVGRHEFERDKEKYVSAKRIDGELLIITWLIKHKANF